MTTHTRFPILAALLALSAACADAPREAPEAAAAAAPTPVMASASATDAALALGVPNAHEPVPGLLTAGQVSPAQMQALAEAGYKTFVSLRLPSEQGAGWEEAQAGAMGVSFSRIPFGGAEGLTRENVEALDQILKAAGGTDVVLYCGSANRVGALMALRAHWLEGATPEEALALGRAAGMTRLEADVARLLGVTP